MGSRKEHRRHREPPRAYVDSVERTIEQIASERMKREVAGEKRQRPPDSSQIEGRQKLGVLLEPVFPSLGEQGVAREEVLDVFTVTGRRAESLAGLFQNIFGKEPKAAELDCALMVASTLVRVDRTLGGEVNAFNSLVNLIKPRVERNLGDSESMREELESLFSNIGLGDRKQLKLGLEWLRHGEKKR